MVNFNTESRTAKVAKSNVAKFTKELKISTNIIGSSGEPVEVTLGYLALFENNDVLQAIADMAADELAGLGSKLKLVVQDEGIRQERAKRTITFA